MSLEILKKLKPKTDLIFEEEEVHFSKGKLPEELIDIEVYKEQIRNYRLKLPIYRSEFIKPGPLKGDFVRSSVKNLTSGFYEIHIQVGKTEVNTSDRRYMKDNTDNNQSLKFWICYDIEKDVYFVKEEEENFKNIYKEIEETFYSDEIMELIDSYKDIMTNFSPKEFNKQYTPAQLIQVFSEITDKINILTRYFEFIHILTEIETDEYNHIIAVFDEWKQEICKKTLYIHEKLNLNWDIHTFYTEKHNDSKQVLNLFAQIKLEWDRSHYVDPFKNKVYRSFVEYYYQTQRSTNPKFENNDTYKQNAEDIFFNNINDATNKNRIIHVR